MRSGPTYANGSEAIAYAEWLLQFASGLTYHAHPLADILYFSGDDKYVVEPLSVASRHRRLLEEACDDLRAEITY